MTLVAYPSGEGQKAAIIAKLEAHAAADRLIKGEYWENGKGCAVGCTIGSGNHAEYEPRFGIPQALARLEDTIFENLPNKQAMAWPIRFMSAAPVGADLSLVQWQFLDFIVTEALNIEEAEFVREACQPVLAVIRSAARGEAIDASAAWSTTVNAAWSAENAAWSAAWSAENAAWSAAWSAENAAWSAENAAWSAAWSAENAGSAAWIRYSEKLLELMAAAPVGKSLKDANDV